LPPTQQIFCAWWCAGILLPPTRAAVSRQTMAKDATSRGTDRSESSCMPEANGSDMDLESRSLLQAEPKGWALIAPGSGQWERQAFDSWTTEEQELWRRGKMQVKWGIGQVSIRLPVQGWQQFLALVYGYLPFLIPLWWLVWSLATYIRTGTPRFFPFYGICIAVSFALVNEVIVKQICKRVLPASITARPAEAVCKHPGMPSGHVLQAYTMMTWVTWEVLLDSVVYPEWCAIIFLILAPVPWARVSNLDHTVPQVLVSAVIAFFMGSMAFYIRKTHFRHHAQLWDWYNAGDGYKNPYTPNVHLN